MAAKAAHHFAAPTSVVFTVLADPERAARWLAPEPGVLHALAVRPVDLSVRWAPRSHDRGWSGRALVRDAADGGSVVYLEVITADRVAPHDDAPDDDIPDNAALTDALRRLAAEVADATTPVPSGR